MLFFKVEHASGALAKVLAVFTSYSVNLENIHPYADPDGGARACFFVECSGHAREPHLSKALDKLREVTSELRCLGSFVSAAAPMS
jgi:prephenate dehydratase